MPSQYLRGDAHRPLQPPPAGSLTMMEASTTLHQPPPAGSLTMTEASKFASGVSLSPFQHEHLEVYTTAGAGRGVRATASIEVGEVLLIERAVVVASDDALPKAAAETLSKRVLPSLERSRRLLSSMWDGRPMPPLEPTALSLFGVAKSGKQAVPITRLRAIAKLNAFRCRTSWEE